MRSTTAFKKFKKIEEMLFRGIARAFAFLVLAFAVFSSGSVLALDFDFSHELETSESELYAVMSADDVGRSPSEQDPLSGEDDDCDQVSLDGADEILEHEVAARVPFIPFSGPIYLVEIRLTEFIKGEPFPPPQYRRSV